MSPQDFLDSLILDEPRERVFRRVLNDDQVRRVLKNTPSLRKCSDKLFRNLGQNGIISYAEYLFLLTLLTKSPASFQVAFTLFDENNNGQIDKQEFLKIRSLILSVRASVQADSDVKFDDFEAIGLPLATEINEQETKANAEQKLKDEPSEQDTTILLHLFGKSGRASLTFDEFQIFYRNLQKELIEIEFHEFARGKHEISVVDFARLVLRYSVLHKSDQSPYIQRVYERTQIEDKIRWSSTGIFLEQFEQFSMFLNNIEDFAKAVRLYTNANIPVNKSEFIRAVKCSTGFELDPHLVDVLYKIFDDGDGKLSYSEFLGIMNDRLHRGFKDYSGRYKMFGWKPFRDCVMHEVNG
ncbi:Protein C56A3.6 d [Aphelenchoides avenae]|nr:Protein C56A3.6 d [Aphelenchus avenae]